MVQKENTMSTPKILEARPQDGYKIWLKFSDGTAGEVDLSHLAGKGVFTFWNNYENFKKVSVEDNRRLSWSNEIEIDADSLYLKLTGKTLEELFPSLKEDFTRA
jgi:hypothetical protein